MKIRKHIIIYKMDDTFDSLMTDGTIEWDGWVLTITVGSFDVISYFPTNIKRIEIQ